MPRARVSASSVAPRLFLLHAHNVEPRCKRAQSFVPSVDMPEIDRFAVWVMKWVLKRGICSPQTASNASARWNAIGALIYLHRERGKADSALLIHQIEAHPILMSG